MDDVKPRSILQPAYHLFFYFDLKDTSCIIVFFSPLETLHIQFLRVPSQKEKTVFGAPMGRSFKYRESPCKGHALSAWVYIAYIDILLLPRRKISTKRIVLITPNRH